MNDHDLASAYRRLAEALRSTCLQAAIEGYERASADGLCHEGAWECALEAIRTVDLDVLIREQLGSVRRDQES